MSLRRAASAVWRGALKEGKGTVSTETKAISNAPYSFISRFEQGKEPNTNPEELIAAAHASCFSMAVSAELGNANFKPESVSTKATLTMNKETAGWTTTNIQLDLTAKVPGASQSELQQAVDKAKVGCPISRLLKADISVTAKLE